MSPGTNVSIFAYVGPQLGSESSPQGWYPVPDALILTVMRWGVVIRYLTQNLSKIK